MLLLAALAGACASHGARPAPFPAAAGTRPAPPESTERAVEPGAAPAGVPAAPLAVRTALAMLGRPYAAGGSGPERFDCSGLVQYAYARSGTAVPRTVAEQFDASVAIGPGEVRAGDLLFFRISGGKPSHVAIALGDGSFVHAPSERGRVRVERLDTPYWRSRFQGARRIAPVFSTQRADDRK